MSGDCQWVEVSTTVSDPLGLHARLASTFSQTAQRFASVVRVGTGKQEVDGKSIMQILTLGVRQGERVEIRANGPDAPQAAARLKQIVENGIP